MGVADGVPLTEMVAPSRDPPKLAPHAAHTASPDTATVEPQRGQGMTLKTEWWQTES